MHRHIIFSPLPSSLSLHYIHSGRVYMCPPNVYRIGSNQTKPNHCIVVLQIISNSGRYKTFLGAIKFELCHFKSIDAYFKLCIGPNYNLCICMAAAYEVDFIQKDTLATDSMRKTATCPQFVHRCIIILSIIVCKWYHRYYVYVLSFSTKPNAYKFGPLYLMRLSAILNHRLPALNYHHLCIVVWTVLNLSTWSETCNINHFHCETLSLEAFHRIWSGPTWNS